MFETERWAVFNRLLVQTCWQRTIQIIRNNKNVLRAKPNETT